jgi:dipeptidyl aminopeptidase/acylaminoacyl peptidase
MNFKSSFIFIGAAVAIGAGLWVTGVFEREESSETNNVELPITQNQVLNSNPTSTPEVLAKEEEPHAISIQSYSEKIYDGRDLSLGKVLAENEFYTRYYITYKSGNLTISGIMNVPKGPGPFPVLFLNHGYIDPAIYTNGRGLKREQDYLAKKGYIVIHSDYRNHAESSKDPDAELTLRLAYVEDVLNAVMAVKNSELSIFDKENLGMLGHSMGGGISQNISVIKPDLVKAIVLFAPVSLDAHDSYERWTSRRPELAKRIDAAYGSPTTSPEFWKNVNAANFVDRIKTPIMLHHGTADKDVPIEWSDKTAQLLKSEGKTIEYLVYPDQPHEFTTDWPEVLRRTTEFFDMHLK